MKLLEKPILLVVALGIIVTGVVLNNYLNLNTYKLYQKVVRDDSGILINTKTGDAWYLFTDSSGYPIKEKYELYKPNSQ